MKAIIYTVLAVLLIGSVVAITDNGQVCDPQLESNSLDLQGRGHNKCHDVPEFSAVAAGIAVTGASAAFILLRRRK